MIEEEAFKEIKELALVINEITERGIEESIELVDDIIRYKNKDEEIISHTFDKMLSIAFASEDSIKEIYYKLLNYTKKFNKKLSDDYEEFFIEQFSNIDDELDMYK